MNARHYLSARHGQHNKKYATTHVKIDWLSWSFTSHPTQNRSRITVYYCPGARTGLTHVETQNDYFNVHLPGVVQYSTGTFDDMKISLIQHPTHISHMHYCYITLYSTETSEMWIRRWMQKISWKENH